MSILRAAPARTLRVFSPAIPVILGAPSLEPVRLSGREGVNGLFEYELLLKTPDALNLGASGAIDFDLDAFIGRELSCVIELDGAGEFIPGAVGASTDRVGAGTRQINALITDACLWGEEGRHVQYKLTLRPWLHLANLSTDCKIFQNQTVVEILDELLADYPFPVDKRLVETYPTRDYQTQFNESDFEFFSRLCEEWGINYFFEHSEGKHRLVLLDTMGAWKNNESQAYQAVEYHAPGWKTDAEYLHSFVPANRLTSGQYSTRDYDYTRPRADLTIGRKDPRPTGQADAEVYQWHAGQAGSHYVQPRAGTASGSDPQGEGAQLALLRMQALRTAGSRATASGNLRAMVPGCTFRLQKHPRQAANTDYLILEATLLIEDVAQDSQIQDAAPHRKQHWKVEVDLTAHPLTEPLRPVARQAKPHTHGPQVARVVGPAGENLWTDDLGRIKVQFPWDRLGQKDQHATCWLRVTSPWAGNQLGGVHIPRIGQEVIVDFIGGDPDLPICTGRVHNQMNLPPWELPGQSALSGFRSRELTKDGGNSAAGRSNHLVLDDTDGKIQAQLKSDYQHSQLSLGHITRIEDNAGRKDPRGEGFELRTDGHGAVRAKDGLLITTEGRANAANHVKDMDETIGRLKSAQEQHEGLAQAASTAKAQSNGQDQGAVAKALKAQRDALKGEGQVDRHKAVFPELSGAHLVLASAAGVAATTSHSVHLQAGEHIAVTSQAHTSISAAKRLLISAKDGLRLFALKNGIKVIAGNHKVQIEAHKDKIDVTAKQAVRITSTTESIFISAPKKVVINGGGSFTEWSATGNLKAGAAMAGVAGGIFNMVMSLRKADKAEEEGDMMSSTAHRRAAYAFGGTAIPAGLVAADALTGGAVNKALNAAAQKAAPQRVAAAVARQMAVRLAAGSAIGAAEALTVVVAGAVATVGWGLLVGGVVFTLIAAATERTELQRWAGRCYFGRDKGKRYKNAGEEALYFDLLMGKDYQAMAQQETERLAKQHPAPPAPPPAPLGNPMGDPAGGGWGSP